jgi:hypothetical protein
MATVLGVVVHGLDHHLLGRRRTRANGSMRNPKADAQ